MFLFCPPHESEKTIAFFFCYAPTVDLIKLLTSQILFHKSREKQCFLATYTLFQSYHYNHKNYKYDTFSVDILGRSNPCCKSKAITQYKVCSKIDRTYKIVCKRCTD